MVVGVGLKQCNTRPRPAYFCAARRNHGFSLIELVVAVVIVGIFAGLAVPNFTSLIHKNSVLGAANELYNLLQYSRSEAITRNSPVMISAPGSSLSAWGGAISVSATGVTLPLRQLSASGLQTGVSVTTAVGALTFSSTGNASMPACFAFKYADDIRIRTQYVGVQGSGRITAPSTTVPATGECR